jgi:plastocyanin
MTVDPAAVYVETINVTASGATSFSSLNQTVQLSATASNPRQGDVTARVTFTWSSSLPAVASVSTSGLVTALGNGNAAISATSNGVSGSLSVAVAQVVATVSVSTSTGGASASLASLGETVQLIATARDAGSSPVPGAAFNWSSDAPAVATVDASGLLTAVANGAARVTARATSNQVANAPPGFGVTVQQVVASVSVLPATISIPRCTTQQFAATPRDARGNRVASAPAATWSSASPSVATVDPNNGLARGARVGGPIAIRATVGSVFGDAQLTVNSSPIVVSWNLGAQTTPVNLTICAGQSVVWRNTNLTHTATGTPAPPPNTGAIQPRTDSMPQPFTNSGSFQYVCLNHPGMTGTVTVTP